MGLQPVGKGLEKYRTKDIVHNESDDTIDPHEEVIIDYDKYKNYIERIARRFYKKLPKNPRWDLDEFISEAWLALCECAERYYNPEYNDSLKAYAYPYIVKRLSEFMSTNMYSLKTRYYNVRNDEEAFARINNIERTIWTESKPQAPNANHAEITNPLIAYPSGIISIAEEVGHKEEVDIIKQIVNNELPMQERRAIVRRFRNGETYREIGKRLKVSPQTALVLVKRGLERIKQKAENAGINSNQDM